MRPAAGRWRGVGPVVAMCVLLALLALLVGRVNEPPELYDDAAITFRYAERLVDGHGLTYNDHERVMGFSNPLWTLTLGAARTVGLPMLGTARTLCLLLLMASAVLAGLLGRRLSNLGGGVAAGLLLIGTIVYVQQMVSGMEVALTTTLGLAAVLAASHRREWLTGVLLGLAVVSKLDAALLAVPLAVGWWWAHRRIPWRMTLAAIATFAPWAIFATAYYGSAVPHSFTTKLGDRYRSFDRWWVVKQADLTLGVLAAGFTAVRLRRGNPSDRVAVVALAGWFLAQFVALAAIDLGDTYPWYLTSLFPPIAILAGAAIGRLIGALAAPGDITVDRRWLAVGGLAAVAAVFVVGNRVRHLALEPVLDANRLGVLLAIVAVAVAAVAWSRAGPSARAALRVVATGTALAVVGLWWVRVTYAEPLRDLPPNPYAEIEVDRVAAGRTIADLAEPGEVVLTGWGWPAYEAIDNPVLDTSGLNMEELPPGAATWITTLGSPIDQAATAPAPIAGYRPVAHITHTCRIDPRWTWYTVFVAIGSPADERSPVPPETPENCGADALAEAVAAGAVPPG